MEQDQDRCGYEDRREGTDEDTKQHRGYEGTYDLAAQQEQRQQGQESGYGGHRRAREHFVVGQVKQLAERHLLESPQDRKSTRLNSSHVKISYAVFCLKKKKTGTKKAG